MYFVLTSVAWFVSRLSDAQIDRLARCFTVLIFDLLRIRRDLMLKNLTIAFGDSKSPEARLAIGRASVYHFALTILECLRGYNTDITGNIEIKGESHIRDALAKQQGAYVLCFHLGNWEAMAAKVSKTVVPAHALVKPVGSAEVNRFVEDLRSKSGFLTVKRNKKGDGYAAMKAVLGRREIVGFIMDQARPGEPKLPFFGKPAKTNTGLAIVWRRLQAPIVPVFIHRTGVSRHIIEFLPEVELPNSGDFRRDILVHSELFNKVVEECVRKHPDQYFWMHNRWK